MSSRQSACRSCGAPIDCKREYAAAKAVVDIPVSCGASGPDTNGEYSHGETWQCFIAVLLQGGVIDGQTGTVDVIDLIPQQPQRQDSLTDQLHDLRRAANRLGLRDAADWVRGRTL